MADINKREYYEFIRELDTLRSGISNNFGNMTIRDLDDLISNIDSTLSQWDYLNEDIEKMFEIIDNIEE